MELKKLMRKPVVIEHDMLLEEAAKIMSEKDISSLIIIAQDKPIGIITEEDLVEHFGKDNKISEVMARKLITIQEKDSAERAIQLMKEHKIGVLPIVDDNGLLVGVVNAKDLLREACETSAFMFE